MDVQSIDQVAHVFRVALRPLTDPMREAAMIKVAYYCLVRLVCGI